MKTIAYDIVANRIIELVDDTTVDAEIHPRLLTAIGEAEAAFSAELDSPGKAVALRVLADAKAALETVSSSMGPHARMRARLEAAAALMAMLGLMLQAQLVDVAITNAQAVAVVKADAAAQIAMHRSLAAVSALFTESAQAGLAPMIASVVANCPVCQSPTLTFGLQRLACVAGCDVEEIIEKLPGAAALVSTGEGGTP